MPVLALPSFAKGVIAPSLYARVDTNMYKTALRTARNCIIHPYGGVSNRPGALLIGPVKDHTNPPRLFRFHLGTTDQYVLEFGNEYMRVIRNDGFVLNASINITAITQANPIVVTAVAHGLSDGEEVFISGVGGMVQLQNMRFIVTNSTTNTLQLQNQVTGEYVDSRNYSAFTSGGTVAEIFELATPYLQADLETVKMVQNGNTLTITHPSYAPRDLTRSGHNNWTLSTLTFAPTLGTPGSVNVATNTSGSQTTKYQVTAISDTDGSFEESLAGSAETTTGAVPPDNTITWATVTNAQRYAVYRQDNGIYGLLGETEELTFKDVNIATDLSIGPPRSRNPFVSTFPAASGYFEQRQVYGATDVEPDKSWYSQTGLRLNMSVSNPLQADDAITASLSSQDVQEIRHYISLEDLIVFTNAGEWRVNSGPDSAFSADTIKQKQQTNWGSSHRVPIIMGRTILFLEDGDARVRSLGFSLQEDGYVGTDMTILANHLLAEEGPNKWIAVDWTHSQFPEPRIFIVRSDGKVLTMTFNQEQEVIAWTVWDTKGKYESCTSLRRSVNAVEDGVYFVIKRTINGQVVRFIERVYSRKFSDPRDQFFVDAGHLFDNPVTLNNITSADPLVITAPNHGFVEGQEIEITDIVWETTTDEFGNEIDPAHLNDLRFTVRNPTTNTFQLEDTTNA